MAPIKGSMSLFRRLMAGPTRDFTCRQCLRSTNSASGTNPLRRSFVAMPFRPNANHANPAFFRLQTRQFFAPSSKRLSSSSLAAEATADSASVNQSGFPNVTSKAVAYWLLGSAASVFGIVVFGGLTRLTESG